MANVLKGLRQRSVSPQPTSKHDLDAAAEKADDARDIAKDLLRRHDMRELRDYTADEEESTARHEMPQQHFHVTVNNGSQPNIELEGEVAIGPVKVKGLPKWLVATLTLVVAAFTAFLASRLGR